MSNNDFVDFPSPLKKKRPHPASFTPLRILPRRCDWFGSYDDGVVRSWTSSLQHIIYHHRYTRIEPYPFSFLFRITMGEGSRWMLRRNIFWIFWSPAYHIWKFHRMKKGLPTFFIIVVCIGVCVNEPSLFCSTSVLEIILNFVEGRLSLLTTRLSLRK